MNEHHDCVIKDINGNVNIAGYGINLCQRIMNVCNGNNILLGRKAYEVLPEEFVCDRSSLLVRMYRVYSNCRPVILITEHILSTYPHPKSCA